MSHNIGNQRFEKLPISNSSKKEYLQEIKKRYFSSSKAEKSVILDEFSRVCKEYNSRFAVNMEVPDIHKTIEGLKLEDIFCYKTTRQVRNDYTINLAGGYIQLLKGKSPFNIYLIN